MHDPNRRRRGFTLIELTIVVTIIAILAALLVPTILNQVEKARRSREIGSLKTIASSILRFHQETGEWPALDNPGTWLTTHGSPSTGMLFKTFLQITGNNGLTVRPSSVPACDPNDLNGTPCWNGPYYIFNDVSEMNDAWGMPRRYVLIPPAGHNDGAGAGGIIVYSTGPNRRDDFACADGSCAPMESSQNLLNLVFSNPADPDDIVLFVSAAGG